MKILIADDIEDNREILERLIVQYSRKYDNECRVYQAQNGIEAVQMCKDNPIDLIFMDIMMPIMDGLEATKIINKVYPNIMIIVVSSENDENIKQDILNAGAEDYVHKPLSSAIMLKRLNNYTKLISTRNSIGFQTQAINTFTSKVYSYQIKFFISNDDELSQFWETLLVRLDFQNHIDQLSDFVRFVFRLGTFQIQKSYKCHLYIEEDENFFYFSMDNMKLLSSQAVNSMIEKYCSGIMYEEEGDYISFALPRITQDTSFITPVVTQTTPISPVDQEENITTPEVEIQKDEVRTYDILDADALAELEFVLTKLKTEIMMMGSSDLEIEDIDTINEYVKKLTHILSVSNDTYEIANSLGEFTSLLDEHAQPFLDMSKDLSHMMQSFINDIIMWKDMIFYTGAPSVNFLDNSISSNVKMIKALFVVEDGSDENLDDIFDF